MSACILKHFLDTLSDVLDKWLRFSLIKIESVSIYPSQAMLGSLFSSVVYAFWLKMLSLVLIKNRNSFVYLIWILSNKLDLNQETHFTIVKKTYLRVFESNSFNHRISVTKKYRSILRMSKRFVNNQQVYFPQVKQTTLRAL